MSIARWLLDRPKSGALSFLNLAYLILTKIKERRELSLPKTDLVLLALLVAHRPH